MVGTSLVSHGRPDLPLKNKQQTISIFTRGGIKKVLQIFPDTNYRMVNWWCAKSFRPSDRFVEGVKAARGSNITANKPLKNYLLQDILCWPAFLPRSWKKRYLG